jgi:hypothetical protein
MHGRVLVVTNQRTYGSWMDYTLTYRLHGACHAEIPEQGMQATIFERLHSTYVPTHQMQFEDNYKSNIRKH